MKILAIESSCDELSIGVIENGRILCNVVSSQIENHKQFGGVVPELAARLHLENLNWVLNEVQEKIHLDWNTINQVAYTANPGLLGSLIIGKMVAETIGAYLDVPIVPLDHIEGHIFASSIDNDFVYPVLALIVSGGHTQIELVRSPNDFEIIGSTIDDAIGESYDKVARVLGFDYPGGPQVDKLAQLGTPTYQLPLSKNDQSYDFSYSGLKTAAINLIHNLNQKQEPIKINDFCASFQEAATKVIAMKLERAIQEYKPQTLTVGGGVSANSKIRTTILELGKKYQITKTIIPKFQYCTDNGAMMAQLAYAKFKKK
ncbi:tRNA (adenosine(37)-N6)-threonylcarbamoyltransferase complex transferase subunit TsaD [Williamsoniiplasma luminosum]|uniref:tRNA N6-adenosine threonylcarbamoyltransferase n=1 Tax=Williamsoniiplasma luminosum TaxID=214888 RepID=A0A2S0NKB1_9MOLU|nr:tRNA (adenosine(37)-N6)-threonylcarbamoyltransferase complex transferase subunit TsaD [Williamsoniiplasma luminosum]AVP49460.1 MAG: tRNA (adenosine(37)-N6)-threonylcarbamoyltransferase complex transferase subunit TsaD [Williamsoniiplasma luminosum]